MNFYIIIFSGLFLGLVTLSFGQFGLHPAARMICSGFGIYLAYIVFHTFLFDRWISVFQCQSNVGYLIYSAETFGYLGSNSVMLVKNFIHTIISWLGFFKNLAYTTAGSIVLLSLSVCLQQK